MQQGQARSRSGSALLFSVVAVMVVSILAAGFLQLALSVTRRTNASSDTQQAFNLAEAGLVEAYTGLGVAHTGNVGSAAAPAVFGGGLFWVEAVEHENGLVELQSTAMYGTGRATLGLACEPVATSVGSLGFFTLDGLRLNPDSLLDSYNSAQGDYAGQKNTASNNKGVIGSNGDISIASGDYVYGAAVNGPLGKTALAGGAYLTGGSSSRPELEVLPPIEVPEIALAKAKVYTGSVPLIIPPGEAGFAGLEVGKNSQVVLKGPLTLVVGTLKLRLGSTLKIDTTDGPVEVYVKDTIDMDTSSTVATSSQVTGDTRVYVSAPAGKTVTFGAKSQFYGFIYAPEADVKVVAKFEVYGGVVCKSLSLSAQGRMHYDTALGATLQSVLPTLRSWRVVELPKAVAAKRIDPFQVLGLDPDTLPSPAQAHEDQVLEVSYVGTDGNQHSYSGNERDFDWGLVGELLYGVRDGLAFFAPEGTTPPPDTTGHSPLLDLVNSGMSSKQLRDALLAAGTVPEEVLVAACGRTPAMSSSDLRNVLDNQPSLTHDVLMGVISSAALSAGDVKNVLIDNSPLAADVLATALARIPPLSLSDITNLLAAQ